MKRYLFGMATACALSACSGGNPFLDEEEPPTDPVAPGLVIPAEVASDLDSVVYDPTGPVPTLTVKGVTFEGDPFSEVYARNTALDSGDYQAFTRQASALDAHSTAYVRAIGDTQGAIVVTGGQFGYYNGGGTYSRAGAFDRPGPTQDTGNVKYSGTYVGLLNYPDNGNDLIPAPGVPVEQRPRQAGRVTGDARIVADFDNNRVKGLVSNRNYTARDIALQDLEIAPTDINPDGSFAGEITQNQQKKGEYGGIFGGPEASAVAGALYAEDHQQGLPDIEEYGLFVLDREPATP
ncbi:factor H binding protein domain-containing protein [Sedimentitalea arenosa]|jgi:hypothetical protein|uniref:Thymidylate synthase n=1 Tax=Sedimentitalea arenosa TaxID=2798803 RepID=A0A8J7J506_9RHOB|nr:factor H binding protein domain-containing protein [Arenibacterium arenosum]MBJ6370057.1 thymidylate synthase [Arenibacterium arenosum]